jgi:hypothetical protein
MSVPRPRSAVLAVDRLEPREMPSVTWALPPGGGSYAIAVRGPDLVLERAGGGELARTPAAGASVVVRGTAADEVLTVDLRALPRVTAISGGGNDALQLASAGGDGLLTAGPGWVRSADGTFRATGFPWIEVTADGAARARVAGSASDDVAEFDGGRVVVGSAAPGWQVRLNGFTGVEVRAGTGYDEIDVRDSRHSDEFTFTPAGGELQRGDGITQWFVGFERAVYTGDGGGKADHDVVRLTGGPEGTSYRAVGRSGLFLDAENDFAVRLKRLDEVHLTGAGTGLDVLSSQARGYALRTDGVRSVGQLRFAHRLSRAEALPWIKRLALRLDPGLATVPDRMGLVLRLRDFVHHRVRQGGNTTAWPQHDDYARFVQAIVSREEAVSCQGAAWLYRDVLNAFGVEAREVSLFSRTYWQNHASVEVRLDGRWVVMDPTFNVAFTNDAGRLLSYQELAKLGRWTVRTDGLVPRHKWVIDRALPYSNYLYRIEYPPLQPG